MLHLKRFGIEHQIEKCTGGLTNNLIIGSDPVGAALCFYKGLKVYPEPRSLISIYDNTVPKDVLEILALMVAQDSQLNVGPIGGKSDAGSDHHVE